MVNEAAEKFAGAVKEYHQALADRSVSAQELNAQLTQEFFNGVSSTTSGPRRLATGRWLTT